MLTISLVVDAGPSRRQILECASRVRLSRWRSVTPFLFLFSMYFCRLLVTVRSVLFRLHAGPSFALHEEDVVKDRSVRVVSPLARSLAAATENVIVDLSFKISVES